MLLQPLFLSHVRSRTRCFLCKRTFWYTWTRRDPHLHCKCLLNSKNQATKAFDTCRCSLLCGACFLPRSHQFIDGHCRADTWWSRIWNVSLSRTADGRILAPEPLHASSDADGIPRLCRQHRCKLSERMDHRNRQRGNTLYRNAVLQVFVTSFIQQAHFVQPIKIIGGQGFMAKSTADSHRQSSHSWSGRDKMD